MSNELSYLNYNRPSVTSSVPSTGSVAQPLISGVEETIRKFETDRPLREEMQLFKRIMRDELVKNYEKPFYQELELIKRRRGGEEYKMDIKRLLESLSKMREITEESLVDVKRYLDYVEVKEGESRLYLPGLEEKRQLGKFRLPDLLGFTRSAAKAEIHSELILQMARTFIGLDPNSTLTNAIEAVKLKVSDYNKLATTNECSMNLCYLFKNEQVLKPLYKIDSYYNILLMLETGNFDINKFLVGKKEEGNGKNRDRERDRDRDRGRDKDRGRGLFRRSRDELYGGKLFNRKKDRNRGSRDSLSSLLSGNRSRGGRDDIEKKMLFILKKENFVSIKKKVETMSPEENVSDLKKILKNVGLEIFKGKSTKNNKVLIDLFNSLVSSSKRTELCKNPRDALKDPLSPDRKNMQILYDNFQSMVEDKFSENIYEKKRETMVIDFMIGKKRYVNNDFYTKSCEEKSRGFLDLYVAYHKLYLSYNFTYLPRATDSAVDNEKTSVMILIGVGVYLNILRDMLLVLEKRLMSDPLLIQVKKEEEKAEVESREERERSNRAREEYREYREILREIDKQIFEERNKNKKDRLMKLREEVVKSVETTSQPKVNNRKNQIP